MKIKTVGLLAGASMAITMLGVWALTPPGGLSSPEVEKRADAVEVGTSGAPAAAAAKDRASFEDGGTLRVEGRLGHATLTAGQDSETYVLVNVRSSGEIASAPTTPVDLAIVIDRSGSMAGKKMQNAINAAQGMVRRLRDGDRVSVITYSTTAETLVAPTTITAQSREDVVARVSTVVPNGDTCISCGIEAGMRTLESSFATGMVKRILLLSDGQATAGVRDEQGFRSLAARVREMSCSISSVGVDVDYNQRIMSAIASESNGRHYFVDDAFALSTIFDGELDSLVRTVAADAEVRLNIAPGVQVVQVFDRTFRREGSSLVVPMGTFSAGEEKTLLVKVRVPRGAEGERPIADVRLSYRDMLLGSAGSSAGSLLAALSDDPSQKSVLDPLVGARLGRATTTASLRTANDLFEGGNATEAQKALANQRQALSRQRAALASMPKPSPAAIDDLDRQDRALAQAEQGFSAPPTGAPPSPAARPGKAQVRTNEAVATDMAF